jgi:hypothetical protein
MKGVSKTGRDFVEASYKATDGSRVTGNWESLDAEAVAAGRPWRTFPWYLGQKSYAGLYWCAPRRTRTWDMNRDLNSRDSCLPTSIKPCER